MRLLHEAAAKVADSRSLLSLLSVAGYLAWSSARHPDQLALARRTEELNPPGDGPAAALRSINSALRRMLEGDTVAAYGFPSLPDDVTAMPVELRMIVVHHAIVRADLDGMSDYAEAMVQECRSEGRLGRLPQALTVRAIAEVLGGRHRCARATVAQAASLAADVGQPMWSGYLAGVQAWLAAAAGEERECLTAGADALRDAERRAWMPGGCWAEYARVLLDLGAGRYEAVLERLDRAAAGPSRHAFVWRYAWPDYVEAAVRSGQPDRAAPLLSRYEQWATATGRDGPGAVLHRTRALLAADDEADALYQRALQLHHRAAQPFDEARTRLLYGEWLRRQQRRTAAGRNSRPQAKPSTPWTPRPGRPGRRRNYAPPASHCPTAATPTTGWPG